MPVPPLTVSLGSVVVTVLNVGPLRADLREWLGRTEWPAEYAGYFAAPFAVPLQCVHIALPGLRVLVDAPGYELVADSTYVMPDSPPPPPLHTQLSAAGLDPARIDHVVVTHAHFDHYAGLTNLANNDRPAFPNARIHLGRADWERPAFQDALADPTALEARTLGLLHAIGRVTLVDRITEIGPGVTIVPAPGETPGHQIVRLQAGHHTLYVLGDLFHHQVQIEHPDWMVTWADPPKALDSRRALMATAITKNARLIAAHIPGVGRLQRTGAQMRWTTMEQA